MMKYENQYHNYESINYKSGDIDYKNILVTSTLQDFYKNKGLKMKELSLYTREALGKYGLNFNFLAKQSTIDSSEQKEKKSYIIPKTAEDILALMIKSTKDSVVNDKTDEEKINIDDINIYNKNIFKYIEKLPKRVKNNIKLTDTYKMNKELQVLLNMLLDRVNLLLNILLSKSDINAGDQIKRLISYIDRFLYSYAEKQIDLEIINEMQGSSDDRGLKNPNEGNYLLESIFKEEFLNSIQTNVEMLDYLKTNDISSKKLKSDLKEVEKLYKDNEIDKKKSFESENIYILNDLYQLGIKDQIEREAYIQRYKEELERQQEEIENWEKGLKSFKKEKKYFFNPYNIPEILKIEFYNKYVDEIVEAIISQDFLENYIKIRIDDEKHGTKNLDKKFNKIWNAMLNMRFGKIDFLENIFGNYPLELRISLIHSYARLIFIMQRKLLEILYNEGFFKAIEFYGTKGMSNIRTFFRLELNKSIMPFIDGLQDVYNEKTIEKLKEMYNEQDKKDKKFNTIKQKFEEINDKIKKLEVQESDKEKNTENKNKRTEIKNELLKVNSLKSATSVVIGKMFITALYKDKDFMNKEELDLKEFLKELDENNIICD